MSILYIKIPFAKILKWISICIFDLLCLPDPIVLGEVPIEIPRRHDHNCNPLGEGDRAQGTKQKRYHFPVHSWASNYYCVVRCFDWGWGLFFSHREMWKRKAGYTLVPMAPISHSWAVGPRIYCLHERKQQQRVRQNIHTKLATREHPQSLGQRTHIPVTAKSNRLKRCILLSVLHSIWVR